MITIPLTIRKTIFLLLALFSFSTLLISKGINEYPKIIIKNITLADPFDRNLDVNISLVIDHKILTMMVQDSVDTIKVDIALDAKGGYLFGLLEIDEPANFIILGQDPRNNKNVLPDTKSYSTFSASNGTVILNKLQRVDIIEHRPYMGWYAYNHPLINLPVSYHVSGKLTEIRTPKIEAVLNGAVLLDYTNWIHSNDNNIEQVGELKDFNGGEIRGFRAGVVGKIHLERTWTFSVYMKSFDFDRGFEVGDLNGFMYFDYQINMPFSDNINISLGKIKEPISFERLSSILHVPFQERASVSDVLLPSRNVGALANGTMRYEQMTWAVGLFNDFYEKGVGIMKNPTVLTGRVSGIPFVNLRRRQLLHLGFSTRISNSAGGERYRTQTEIYQGPKSVEANVPDARFAIHNGVELMYNNGPWLFGGEYLQVHNNRSNTENSNFRGFYLYGSYVFTGEARTYNLKSGVFNKLNPKNSIKNGGYGMLEGYGRISNVNLSSGGIDGGIMNTLSLGINWRPLEFVQWSATYRLSTLNKNDKLGYNQGAVVRLILSLE